GGGPGGWVGVVVQRGAVTGELGEQLDIADGHGPGSGAASPTRRVSRIRSRAGDSCWLYIWVLLEELVSIRRGRKRGERGKCLDFVGHRGVELEEEAGDFLVGPAMSGDHAGHVEQC